MNIFHQIHCFFVEHILNPISEKLYIACNGLSCCFSNAAAALERYTKGPAIHYERPTKAEREERNRRIGIGIVVVFVGIALILLVCYFAKYYFSVVSSGLNFSEWNSSAGSFWGAILGAFIAGIATVSTTVLVIQRSYKIDYHRERLEVLPVLDMQTGGEWHEDSFPISEENATKQIREGIPFGARDIAQSLGCSETGYMYIVKNIGKGIAYNIQSSGFAGEEFDEVQYEGILPPGNRMVLVSYPKSVGVVLLTFYDLYENKYQQKFFFEHREEHTIITTHPPELVKKTKRVRYTQ